MTRRVLRRFAALAVIAAMMLQCVPGLGINVSAATVTGLTVNGLGASYTNGSWTGSGNVLSGSATGKDGGTCGSASSETSTLTLTNQKGASALLSFTYDAPSLATGGSVNIDGTSVTAAGTFSKTLNNNGTVTVVIVSGNAGAVSSSITLRNIQLVVDASVTTTFKAVSDGTYTVDGNAIVSDTSITQSSTVPYQLAATPASGFKLLGWYDETHDTVLSTNASVSLMFDSDCTVYPLFVPASSPVWLAGTRTFTDLNQAISYAQTLSEKKVVLIGDGTLAAGSYVIPGGVTVLIPHDDTYAVYGATPPVVYGSHVTPTAYKTLTMASGAEITVQSNGSLNLGGKLCATGQMGGWNGTPTGPDGRICMQQGSSVTVENGGTLYAWGYIYGSGEVTAQNGATVYEAFQIKDWRGGTATSNVYKYAFIFSQYYVQNIEVPLKLYAGAKENLYSSVNASSSAYPISATFIGSGGLFNVSSGYIVKDYIEATDRLEVSVYGNVSVSSMTISGIPVIGSISTGSYILPINGNITIAIHSGTTTVSQDIELLPGVNVIIDGGATFSVSNGKSVYLYDLSDWGNFTGNAQMYVIGYSVANGTTAKRNPSSLEDARFNVNGTVSVSGNLYTSLGGANITSSQGSGQVVLNKAPTATTTISEMAGNSTQTSVSFTAARLHNGVNTNQYGGTDSEYTPTAGSPANTTFQYSMGVDMWTDEEITSITYHANYENGPSNIVQEVVPGSVTLRLNTFERPGHTFAGWNTQADGQGTSYADGATVTVNGDLDLYAQWTPETYEIRFVNHDGTLLQSGMVAYGTTPTYDGQTPAKAADNTYTYTFSGWDPQIAPVTGAQTYTAQFTQTFIEYTVQWIVEGETVQTQTYHYGDTPSYSGQAPSKASDAQYTYAFAGWMPEISPVTADASYTAVFTPTLREYTITWKMDDGSVIDTTTVPYGQTPTHADPAKQGDAQYTYAFAGWTPALAPVTGDAEYTATFTSTLREYTITWKMDDGSVIGTTNVPYGQTPTHADPEKAADAQYTYAFAGWTPALAPVTGDAEYTATFTPTLREYTITWKMDDGSVIGTTTVPYGQTPTHADPEKAADAQYTYAFAGWTPEPAPVTGNAEYTATFTPTLREYVITWKMDDGSVIDTTTVAYGQTPTHADPEKAADAQYTYAFTGWTPELAPVTGDAEYTAVFQGTLRTYEIRFVNYDGELLQSGGVAYGSMPVYSGATPVKPADNTYSYHFDGWTPALAEVTGAQTYTAKFTASYVEYTVQWIVEGETVLTETYHYGETPSYSGQTPAKAADTQYTYTFAGWTPEISAVTADASYTATFTPTLREYTIIWKMDDGSVIDTTTVAYGQTPTHADPEKQADAQYTYAFTGWTPELAPVTGDAEYTAVFQGTLRTYEIRFVNYDGELLQSGEVEYGSMPVYNGATPVKPADNTYNYHFDGWTPALTEVTGAQTYTAKFTASYVEYTIQWIVEGETVLTETYHYGDTPSYSGQTPAKASDAQYNYTFAGWTPEITSVTADASYTAVFTPTLREYVITWKMDDGSVIDTTTVAYGQTPTHADPEKAADAQYTYAFAGWTPELAPVTGNAEYTATFTPTLREYTITWKMDDGSVIGTTTVAYGQTPTHADPEKAADAQYTYTFTGWTPELAPVTGDAEYTAVFQGTLRTYEIRFVNYDGELLQSSEVAYGSMPVYNGATPVKPADDTYSYHFDGWTPALASVTGAQTYTAKFTASYVEYTVRWIVEGETVLTETYHYGETPSYSGQTPFKASDAQYTYTFAGWTPEISAVTADASYTATFTPTLREYTITWKMDDGSVIGTTTVPYGQTPTHADPEKAADAQYTYTFTGWSPALAPVTGNAEYTAVFQGTLRTYEIRFVNYDGELLQSSEVEYGSMPVYSGATPVKPADNTYSYHFDGWTPALTEVTGAQTYTAKFTASYVGYTVQWIVEGETVLTETYHYGETPSYSGQTPTKASDAQYDYTFAGWTPELAPVTGDAEYTATFTPTLREYVITWKMDDGSVIDTTNVPYGQTPAHEDPTKAADAQYTYSFTGWTPELAPVTGDAEYTAVFQGTVRKYEIRFVNYDGELLQSGEVEYGSTPAYGGATPVKPADNTYTYTFSGWDPQIAPVTGTQTYTAQFTQIFIEYTVQWIVEGETVLTETYHYGETPSYSGQTPSKASDAQYTYTFAGWTPEISAVTADASYTAVFTPTLREYTITWKMDDGSVIDTTNVPYGQTPAHEDPTKAADAQYTYAFAGWTPELAPVTGDAEYTATFTPTLREYTITWKMDDGSVIDTTTVAYGQTPTHTDPEKAADAQYTYAFAGWTPEPAPVTGDAEYTATFTPTLREYTITWKTDDGSVIDTTTVAYGQTPTHADPEKAADAQYTYAFAGWTPEPAPVTGDAEYTATFTPTLREYTITWKMDDGSVIDTTTVPYGQTPAHADPEKEADAQYTYSFTGWTPELAPVTGDAEYTAVFQGTLRKYEIRFVNYDGELLQSGEVEYGSTPAYAGETPVRPSDETYTYEFTGWDPEIAPVTGEQTYTAQFRAIPIVPEELVITALENEGTDGGITVSWNGCSGMTKYRVEVSADGGATWSVLTEEETGLSFEDTSAVRMGDTFTYRVSGFGGEWSGPTEARSIVRNPFGDVSESASYFKAIAWAYNNGIVRGTSTTTFSPRDGVTRAQFTLMLYRMSGSPDVSGLDCPFEDLGKLSANTKKAITWAYHEGIVRGTSPTTFNPNGNIQRGHMALMFYRMSGAPEVEGETPFTDIGGQTPNTQKAILWAYNNGIVKGTGDGTTYSPTASTTRSQLVVMLYRFNRLNNYVPS